MDFFQQFFAWLDGQLSTYIGTKAAAVASAIEPAAVTIATVYVMIWGYLWLTGRTEEYVLEGARKIVVLVVVFGVAIELWMYQSVIASTFFDAPNELAASLVGANDTIAIIDQVWIDGNLAAEELLRKGSVLSGDFAYYLAGFVVYLLVGLTAVYTAFLLALSKVAVSLILAIGPIFIILLLFDTTKRFFEAWIAQLANYGLVAILALTAASLMLTIVQTFAANAVAKGGGITIAECARLCISSALVLLIMRQVMPIASGLASGIALGSMGAVSGLLRWGLGTGQRTLYDFSRGAIDGWQREPISRWDSLRRGAGNLAGRQLAHARDHLAGPSIGGSVYHDAQGRPMVPREVVMPPRKHFG